MRTKRIVVILILIFLSLFAMYLLNAADLNEPKTEEKAVETVYPNPELKSL